MTLQTLCILLILGIQLDKVFYSTVTVNFEFILIHEIEHVLGRDHIEDSRWLTPNANLCSGLN